MRDQVTEGIFIRRSILGAAQVAHQDDAAAVVEDLFNGGDGGPHAGIVRDFELIVQGNVKIHPDQGFFIRKVMLAEYTHIIYGIKEVRSTWGGPDLMNESYLEISFAKKFRLRTSWLT